MRGGGGERNDASFGNQTTAMRPADAIPSYRAMLRSATAALGVLCGWTAAAPTDRAEWRAVVCVWLGGGQQARRVSGG
jgi:uncharacterized protein (DUF1501 family)